MAHTALNGVMALAIWPSNHYHNEILRPSQGSTALVFVMNIYFLALLGHINPVDNQNMCYTQEKMEVMVIMIRTTTIIL